MFEKTAWYIVLYCCCPFFLSGQPDMVFVKGGSFLMGDTSGDPDEKPLHRVAVRDFYLSETEITNAGFKVFVEATGYRTDAELGDGSFVWDSTGWSKKEGIHWRHTEFGRLRSDKDDRCPVLHVSWNDAAQYCNWWSKKEGLQQVYDFQGDTVIAHATSNGYRLPAEVEWEYAAAEGREIKTAVFSGDARIGEVAWYSGNAAKKVHPVGGKKANRLGLYDLTGNVWEWCHDRYDPQAYSKETGIFGPSQGALRVLRGGSWNNNSRHCRLSNRTSRSPDFRDGNLGFRVARNKE